MAVSELWTSFAAEEEKFQKLYSTAAESLMSQNGISAEKTCDSACALREELSERRPWLEAGKKTQTDFNEMSTCCAYLKRYAACHCSLARFATMKFLQGAALPTVMNLLNRDELGIVSVGGGPGNDLLGLCSALATRPRLFNSLNLTVVDLKTGWCEVFACVISLVSNGTYGSVSELFEDINVGTRFVQSDMTKHRCLEVVENADIVLMTKVLCITPPERRAEKLEHLFSRMKPGAVFLYIDINSEIVLNVAYNHYMDLLFHWPSDKFTMNMVSGSEAIRQSSYEICAVQKPQYLLGAPFFRSY